jgi:hypothetical protein
LGRLEVYAADRRKVGPRVALAGLTALHAPSSDAVELLQPLADVEPAPTEAAKLRPVNIVVKVRNV